MNKILPYILATITQHDREKVDIKWSNDSFVYNLFRVWELIFWRRSGIRAETTMYKSETKEIIYFHSFESVLVHCEYVFRKLIRGFLPDLSKIRIYVPAFSTKGNVPLPVSPFLFSIAYDNSAKIANAATPISASYTVTGSNPVILGFSYTNTDNSNAPTYNSVSLTSVAATTFPGVGRSGCRAYILANPATGANTYSASATSGSIAAFIHSVSGANSSQPDTSTSTTGSSVSSLTCTVTASANAYLVMAEVDSGAGSGPSYTGGTGTTVRQSDTSLAGSLSDSGGTVSGSSSLIINMNGSIAPSSSAAVLVSIKAIAAANTSGFFRFM